MKSIKKVASISLILFVCSPNMIGYADNNEVIITKIEEQKNDKETSVIRLTLSEAIEKSLENNPEIEESKLNLKKAEVNYREGNYDIRANKKLLEDEKETSIDYLKSVTLLDFTNKFTFENAKRKDEVVRNNIKSEVEELYFNLVQAKKMIDINKSNIDLTKKLYDISQIKLDLGLVTKQEVTNSELNYTKAKESQDQSIRSLENANMLFNIKLGLDKLQKVELVDELEYKEFNIEEILVKEEQENKNDKEENNIKIVEEKEGELEQAIKQALKNRNEIKQLEFKYELEKLNMNIVRMQYPSITFMYRQQEVELEKAKETLESAKNNIDMEIRSSYKEIEQKKTEINSAKRTVELASEGLRIAKVNYEVGKGTALDVDNAQIALNQAKLGLSNSILKHNLEVLNFKTITGLGKMSGGM